MKGKIFRSAALFRERKGYAANGNPRCLLPIILVTITDKIFDAIVAGLPEIERKSDCARVIAVGIYPALRVLTIGIAVWAIKDIAEEIERIIITVAVG